MFSPRIRWRYWIYLAGIGIAPYFVVKDRILETIAHMKQPGARAICCRDKLKYEYGLAFLEQTLSWSLRVILFVLQPYAKGLASNMS